MLTCTSVSSCLIIFVQVYGLPTERIYATYFGGDEKSGLPADNEARDLWLQFLPPSRVLPFDCKVCYHTVSPILLSCSNSPFSVWCISNSLNWIFQWGNFLSVLGILETCESIWIIRSMFNFVDLLIWTIFLMMWGGGSGKCHFCLLKM